MLNDTSSDHSAAEREQNDEQPYDLGSVLTMAEHSERRRLAQILHDGLQQYLFALHAKMALIRNYAEADNSQQVLEELSDAETRLAEAIDITRSLTADLNPPVLQSKRLRSMIEWLQARMHELHGLDVSIRIQEDLSTPKEDVRVLIFRIVHELLFNVAKHAGTRKATVTLHEAEGNVVVVVMDDGTGFSATADAPQESQVEGFGLRSIRERLRLYGGNLNIESAPGEGTEIMVRVPLFM